MYAEDLSIDDLKSRIDWLAVSHRENIMMDYDIPAYSCKIQVIKHLTTCFPYRSIPVLILTLIYKSSLLISAPLTHTARGKRSP